MLEISGILEVRHGRGVFVKELTGDISVPLGRWATMKKQTLPQHFETRLILEPEIAVLAANYANAEDIRLLTENIFYQSKVNDDDLVEKIYPRLQHAVVDDVVVRVAGGIERPDFRYSYFFLRKIL